MADISFGHRVERPSIWARIGNFLELIATSNARVRKFERLNAMSDEQLAAQGIKREDIVHVVFRDVMYI